MVALRLQFAWRSSTGLSGLMSSALEYAHTLDHVLQCLVSGAGAVLPSTTYALSAIRY